MLAARALAGAARSEGAVRAAGDGDAAGVLRRRRRPRGCARRARSTCSGSRTSPASTARSSRRSAGDRPSRLHAQPRARGGRRRRPHRGRGEVSPLDAWARPGRDNVQLLGRLAGGIVEARFVDPPSGPRASRLAALQAAVLDRRPIARPKRQAADDSLTVVPAPDPRRELETIAAEIWSRLRADETLTFADFAVIVPPASAPVYLPLAQAVFDAASRLPHTIVDLPRPAERRILDLVGMLLELPLGALGRPDLLRVAMHPAVARALPRRRSRGLAGALRGAGDRARRRPRRAGAELPRARPHQLGAGAAAAGAGGVPLGARSGEERPFLLDGEEVLPVDLPPTVEPAARALGIIARATDRLRRGRPRRRGAVRGARGAAAADDRRDDPPRARRRGGPGRRAPRRSPRSPRSCRLRCR